MESPRTAVTSFGVPCMESGAEENALCVDEAVLVVNVPRRRKIAEGFSLDSLKEIVKQVDKARTVLMRS
jgi:hypothetical protein